MTGSQPAARELIRRVVTYLAQDGVKETDVQAVADALDVSPKLLLAIPVIRQLLQPAGLEAYLDWTVRDWLMYHYVFVHQGYRYGLPELQPTWRGRTLLKNPLDCWVYQEIVHRTRPDVLLELGVAFGGSALFFADLMELAGHGGVLGVDVSLDRARDVSHPRIEFLEGSSVEPVIVEEVRRRCHGKRVMVFADSNHAADHVLAELRAYADLVGPGMYYIVEDTLADVLNLMPVPIEGPLAAVETFLAERTDFERDVRVAERYVLSQSPYGFLRRVP
ncbi:MAG TPA: CmcI family methyltransferase [Chloroflexota bacterium]